MKLQKKYIRPAAQSLSLTHSAPLMTSPSGLGIHDEYSSQPSLTEGKDGWSSEDWSE